MFVFNSGVKMWGLTLPHCSHLSASPVIQERCFALASYSQTRFIQNGCKCLLSLDVTVSLISCIGFAFSRLCSNQTSTLRITFVA